MGTSPFRTSYGVEAISHVEIGLISPRIEFFDPEGSKNGLCLPNDLIKKIRDKAAAKTLLQQQQNFLDRISKKKKKEERKKKNMHSMTINDEVQLTEQPIRSIGIKNQIPTT